MTNAKAADQRADATRTGRREQARDPFAAGPPDAEERVTLWAANDRSGLAMTATTELDGV